DLLEDLGGGEGGHQAGAVALVVAHAVDVDVVRLVGRVVDLEGDGLAVVHADVGGEPLDGRVAGAGDAPNAVGRAGELVLRDDRVAGEQGPVLEVFEAGAPTAGARLAARAGPAREESESKHHKFSGINLMSAPRRAPSPQRDGPSVAALSK